MGWYAWTLTTSNYFAPVIVGFINDSLGYKWPFFIMAIFSGATFIFLFFFLEESNYVRESVGVVFNDTKTNDAPQKDTDDSPQQVAQAESAPKKSFFQKLALLDPAWRSRPFLMHWRAWQSLKFLTWPTIFYSGFAYGTYLIWFNILNATASLILSAPPYNFQPSIVGLSYIACNLGVIIGSAYTGIMSDWFVIRAARRNKGIYEPEQRLWLFAATTFLVPCSLILWGVGVSLVYTHCVLLSCSSNPIDSAYLFIWNC